MSPVPASASECSFQLGFQAVHDALPEIVGECRSDQRYNDANGDALQETANGLLVWRKADNFTAVTDGHQSWVNGPQGIQQRLNTDRFEWEPADPKMISLSAGDLPAGFVTVDSLTMFHSNEHSIGMSPDRDKAAERIRETGRLYGYVSAFQRTEMTRLIGPFVVTADVDLFANEEGAHQGLARYDEVLDDLGISAIPVAVPAIGDESIAFEFEMIGGEGASQVSLTVYSVAFRSGRIVAGVTTMGLAGGLDWNDNLRYARIMESRIK